MRCLLGIKVDFDYPRDVHFKCLKCAVCCGDTEERIRHILLLKAEAERIAEATSRPIEEFAKKIENHAPYIYEMRKNVKDRRCIFLQDKLCTIYLLRPLICRFYPFELKITRNEKHEFIYTKECPGIGQGEKLTKKYFNNLFRQLTTPKKHERQI